MRQLLSLFLLLLMPLAALADGIFIPPVAFPAQITIPDQRALICLSNGTERLVIETRFTGSGTNFAWVVPLPSQPVVEEATTGLFPTLQYLFRPQIIHYVPGYYLGIFALIWLGYVLCFVRPTGRLSRLDVLACVFLSAMIIVHFTLISDTETFSWWGFTIGSLFILLDLMCVVVLIRFWEDFGILAKSVVFFFIAIQLLPVLLPGLSAAKRQVMEPASLTQAVSILDRKIVGVFETTTIASHGAKALQTWLSENGYAVPTNAEPVIASYVKNGWVFVAAKVHRDNAALDTSTPRPLSFTFKTDKPVYPMRLTGLDHQPLSVDLYVFGTERAAAPHFKVQNCTRPNIVHPLLHQWTAGMPVATKLTAVLSPADMRNDIQLEQTPFTFEQKHRLFSRQGALITALNWGTGCFAAGLAVVCFLVFASEKYKTKLPALVGIMTTAGIVIAGLCYLCLPKIEVKLATGYFYGYWREEQFALGMALDDLSPKTIGEARKGLQELVSNPANAASYDLKNWDNYFVGGQIREEDSPGNYLLRETNNQLQLVTFDANGGEEVAGSWNLHPQH
ncbi:MAG: DUF2330 domain-containing protein [Limisphaerales bacterium]